MSPTTAGVMTIGVSTTARSDVRARISRFTKIAMARPSTSSIAVATAAKARARSIARMKDMSSISLA